MERMLRGGLLTLLAFASLSCSTEQSNPAGEARSAPEEVTREVTKTVTVAEAPKQDKPTAAKPARESERGLAPESVSEPEPSDDAPPAFEGQAEEAAVDQYDAGSSSEPAVDPGAPEPAAADTSVLVGEMASTDVGNEITVYSYEYVPPTDIWQPEPSFEYNAADIEACASPDLGESTDFNPFDFGLQMPDNTRLQPDVGVKEPALHVTTLPPGDCVRGYVTFQVPQGEVPTSVIYAGSSIIKWAVQGVEREVTQYAPPDVPLTDQDISDEYNLEEQCVALGKVVAGRGCVFPEDASNVPLTDAEPAPQYDTAPPTASPPPPSEVPPQDETTTPSPSGSGVTDETTTLEEPSQYE